MLPLGDLTIAGLSRVLGGTSKCLLALSQSVGNAREAQIKQSPLAHRFLDESQVNKSWNVL